MSFSSFPFSLPSRQTTGFRRGLGGQAVTSSIPPAEPTRPPPAAKRSPRGLEITALPPLPSPSKRQVPQGWDLDPALHCTLARTMCYRYVCVTRGREGDCGCFQFIADGWLLNRCFFSLTGLLSFSLSWQRIRQVISGRGY